VLEPAAPEITSPARKASHRPAAVRAPIEKRVAAANPEAELVLLGRAQALLDRNPDGALDVLGEHARDYARGVFSEEREVLALEAESKLGHKALARARAERFIEQFPRSAHARRVRTLLEPAP
jgi:outer membrane protein assembly factor BamD (BamD/ComL family)